MTRLKTLQRAALAAAATLYAMPAWAGGSGMPWETPLQSIVDSVQGPVAKVIGVIIIVITGLTLAFGDTSGGPPIISPTTTSNLRRRLHDPFPFDQARCRRHRAGACAQHSSRRPVRRDCLAEQGQLFEHVGSGRAFRFLVCGWVDGHDDLLVGAARLAAFLGDHPGGREMAAAPMGSRVLMSKYRIGPKRSGGRPEAAILARDAKLGDRYDPQAAENSRLRPLRAPPPCRQSAPLEGRRAALHGATCSCQAPIW